MPHASGDIHFMFPGEDCRASSVCCTSVSSQVRLPANMNSCNDVRLASRLCVVMAPDADLDRILSVFTVAAHTDDG